MTTIRKIGSKAACLKRLKPEYLCCHANRVYRVRIKVNGKSKEPVSNPAESANLLGKTGEMMQREPDANTP